ncbi:S9 family peptidase [soil metagenome]
MFSKFLTAAAVCVVMCAGAARAEIPLAAYGGLPNVEGVEISPDGTMLAVTVTNGEKRILTVRKTDGTMVAGLEMGTHKLRGVRWAGPDHVLVLVSSTKVMKELVGQGEYLMAMDFNLRTGKQTALLDRLSGAMNVIISDPEIRMIDGELHAVVEGIRFADNQGIDTPYRINLKDGVTHVIDYSGSEDTNGWLIDKAGKAVAMSLYDTEAGVWSLKMRIAGGQFQVVDQVKTPMGSYGISGYSFDGKSVLVWMTDDQHRTVLREYAPDGSKSELAQNVDPDSLLFDPVDHRLLGYLVQNGDDLSYTFLDPQAQASWNAVVKAFKGSRVSLASWSDDRRKVVVYVDSPTAGPGYALVDLDAKRATGLGNTYLGVPPEGVSPVRSIRYKAKDGLEITANLTLPRGKDPKNLPLVVLPHGGPEVRDTPGFDWWSQALASRGYAVLQPNFRGSEGFGYDFVAAGFGQWGKAMQTDLSDGVRDLAAQGVVDPKRVCIVGASYGGYAALAGATLDTGVYRCAASIAGLSDLGRFLTDKQRLYEFSSNATFRYWLRFMGADGLKDPDLTALSPAKLVNKVEVPILLIHGKDDTVVPYVQSTIMADALKRAGKPVELVTLNGEDHWLSSGATRLQMLTAVTAFLEKNNPPN